MLRRLQQAEALEARQLMAAEIFVANSGDDWADGTADHPFQTIRRALDAAAPGDTITLRNGVYEGGITIDVNDLTIRSAPGEWAVIESPLTYQDDGHANSVLRYNYDVVGGRLENLEIVGGYYYGVMFWDWWDPTWEAGTTHVGASGITLDGVKVHDTGVDAIKLTPGANDITIINSEIYASGRRTHESADGIDNNNGDRMLARGNYIHDIPGIGILTSGGTSNSVIEQNLVKDVDGAGIVVGFYSEAEWMEPAANPEYFTSIDTIARNNIIVGAGQAGIGVYASRNPQVYNNTIVDAARDAQSPLQLAGIELWLSDADPYHHVASDHPVIMNNIVTTGAGNDTRLVDIRLGSYSDGLTLDHNLYHSDSVLGARFIDRNSTGDGTPEQMLTGWKTAYGHDVASFLANPQLGADWHLLAGSPAIGMAIPLTGLTNDFDGNPRSADPPQPDLGADEFDTEDVRATPPAPFGAPSLEIEMPGYHDFEGQTIQVRVVRHGSASDTVAVDFATLDGSAKAGQDYSAVAGHLIFLPGEVEKIVTVQLLDDALPEGDEHFLFTLANPSTDGAYPVRLGHHDAASMTIDDEQTPPTLNYRTLWVSNDGSDVNGDGSAAHPWKSLQFAADQVGPGDYVIVKPGQYWGMNVTTDGKSDARITFHAMPGVLIDAPNPENQLDGINLEGADYVTIEGFEVRDMPRAGLRSVNNTGAILRGNITDHNGWWGILTGWSEQLLIENNVASRSQREHGIYVSNSSDDGIVRNNIVWGNHSSGIQFNADGSLEGDGVHSRNIVAGNVVYDNGANGGAAINLDGFQDGVVENNLLIDNHATGIVLYVGFAADSSTNNLVRNNTVVMAEDARWALLMWNGSSGNTLVNNIFLNKNPNRGSVTIETGSEPAYSNHNVLQDRFEIDGYSASFAQWQAFVGGLDVNSLVTPQAQVPTLLDDLFVDAAAGDLHLKLGSPAIDAADATNAPAVDVAQHARPSGLGVDIGAFEAGTFAPSVQFAWSNVIGYEMTGMAEVVVTRTGDTESYLAVDWKTLPGTATADVDFVSAAGRIVFRPGETQRTIQVFVNDDAQIEDLETVFLQIQSAGDPFVGDPAAAKPFLSEPLVDDPAWLDSNVPFVGQPTDEATLYVVSDDAWQPGQFEFDASSVTFDETAATATVVVRRVGGSSGPADVTFATGNWTRPRQATWIKRHTDLLYPTDRDEPATAGDDYAPTQGLLNFADGETEKTITIPLVNDDWYEADEAFVVALSVPTGGATLGEQSSLKVRIHSDDEKLPGQFVWGATSYVVTEGMSFVNVTIDRLGGGNVEASVRLYDTGAGNGVNLASAWAPSDYDWLPPVVTFAPGELSKTISIPIVDDHSTEMDEAFSIQLYSPSNDATVGSPSVTTVTILDNESTFYFRGATPDAWSFQAVEGTGQMPVTIARVGATTTPASVTISTGDWSSATSGVDFIAQNIVVNFAPGETLKMLNIPLVNDTLQESQETFPVNMSNAVGAEQGSWTWSAKIIDDDVAASPGKFSFSAATYSVNENDGMLEVTVQRAGGADGTVTVQYRTSDGASGMPYDQTAYAGGDYSSKTGTLSFGPGETTKTFSVPITNDTRVEKNEFFTVQLYNPAGGATLGAVAKAVVTIVEDDSAIEFAKSTYSANESDGWITITLVRKGSSANAATVDLNISGGSAGAGSDFVLPAGKSVAFAPGESTKSIQLQVVDDVFKESDEWFYLSLTNAAGAGLGSSLWANGKITDND